MDKRIQDRRIRKTKKILRDTLIELMHEKNLEKITVKDLTERADLNRGTFYLHYSDIYDLLEKSENEALKEITQILSKINPNEFAKYNFANKQYPPLVELFEWFKDNISFGKALMGGHGSISFLDKISITAKRKLCIKQNKSEKNTVFNNYFNSYIIFGFLGIIKQWFDSEASTPPEEMATIFLKILLKELKVLE
jgi:AcrR family transcriptional regulator